MPTTIEITIRAAATPPNDAEPVAAIGDRRSAMYTADLRAELPTRRADLAEGAPIALSETTLGALEAIPDAYAGALTGMLFTPPLREAWRQAVGYAEGAGGPLRVRLALQGDDALHAIRWELLREPIGHTPLAHSERFLLARFLSAPSLAALQAPARPQLRAVVAVSGAGDPQMARVDIPGEVARARQGLGEIPTDILDGRAGRPAASLPALADALRAGPHILYLVCHGSPVAGVPSLWLAPEGGDLPLPTPGAELARQIAALPQPPLLIVLAACQGAGDAASVLGAVGPQLARAGVGAVIAMRGDVPMELVARLTPRLFAELRRDGQIDRALAAARAALPADQPWWRPTLWMAVRDGALWRDDPAAPPTPPGVQIAGNVETVQVIHVSGGSVGSIIGKQVNSGWAPPPTPAADPAADLRRRLEAHRATLATYLTQLAIAGTANTRPEVLSGIREARAGIRQAKAALRSMGVDPGDHPDDAG